jgi:MarR family transcriptional regulator for hemolysin
MASQNISLLEMGKMMHEVFRVFKKRSEELTHVEIKISAEQFSLLFAITTKEEDVIQKDMAEMMGKDKSVILRLIDSLEKKELVRRVADLKDRRKNYLMVTKSGHRVIDQYMKVISDMMEELQQGLTQAEIDSFHKVVGHLKTKAGLL